MVVGEGGERTDKEISVTEGHVLSFYLYWLVLVTGEKARVAVVYALLCFLPLEMSTSECRILKGKAWGRNYWLLSLLVFACLMCRRWLLSIMAFYSFYQSFSSTFSP